MATPREARRALARGDTDAALVDLWNALEPLRLRGDTAGLHQVARMAADIARTGDGSQAREAERLLGAVRDTLDPDAARTAVHVGAAAAPAATPAAHDMEDVDDEDLSEPLTDFDLDEVEVEDGDDGRPRLGGLVWALIVAAFVLFNVVSGLLRD